MTSKIEWTEETWNPLAGCSLESPGCTNCYAMKMAGRLEAMGQPAYQGTTQKSKAGFVWTGKVNLSETALLAPLKRKTPTVYFVNSMSDLFHESVPNEWIDRIFAVMALCPQHTFQVLTKRAARMREYCQSRFETEHGSEMLCEAIEEIDQFNSDAGGDHDAPLPNVWLGVSVEDQARADQRIPDLLATPAAVRFLSCEPLLGPVDLTYLDLSFVEAREKEPSGLTTLDALSGLHYDDVNGDIPGILGYPDPRIDWVIVGGESGPGSRPMHPDWARALRDQCEAAGTAFFFKQWGEWYPAFANDYAVNQASVRETLTVEGTVIHRIGKKAAGRLLDGKTHDAMPQTGGAA